MNISMNNKDTLRYITGACFAAEALLSVISFVYFGFSFWGLLSLAGYALISVSMFLTMPVLTTVGGGISLAVAIILLFKNTIAPVIRIFGGIFSFLRNFIFNLPFILSGGFGYSFITSILHIALWVIILIVGFKREKAKQLSLVAGIVAALRFIIVIISTKAQYGTFHLSFRGMLFNHISLFLIIGAFLIGYAYANMPVKAAAKPSASAGSTNAVSPESQTDRLIGIKRLLDSGVITQEEFEEKKKQILGS